MSDRETAIGARVLAGARKGGQRNHVQACRLRIAISSIMVLQPRFSASQVLRELYKVGAHRLGIDNLPGLRAVQSHMRALRSVGVVSRATDA